MVATCRCYLSFDLKKQQKQKLVGANRLAHVACNTWENTIWIGWIARRTRGPYSLRFSLSLRLLHFFFFIIVSQKRHTIQIFTTLRSFRWLGSAALFINPSFSPSVSLIPSAASWCFFLSQFLNSHIPGWSGPRSDRSPYISRHPILTYLHSI